MNFWSVATLTKLLGCGPAPPPGTTAERHRFLLIKAWGCGFWSDMNHVFGSLLLAEITGRTPVTHWGSNSLFRDETGSDAFRLYFEPVSSFDIEYLTAIRRATFFPAKWSRSTLRRENVAKWEGPDSRLSGRSFLG